jgi:hypothetical protein
MPSTPSLLDRLRADHPQLIFKAADRFYWSPSEQVIYYDPKSKKAEVLLHEISHSLLGHEDYSRDIELLAMERQAWDKAGSLSETYQVKIDDDTIQEYLDTYRDWLHARSTCPECQAIGHESRKHLYKCVACGHSWRVNEARICGLKRYGIKK